MTRPVSIVIDSTACLPAEFVQTLPINVVPNILNWMGKSYRDMVDIQPEDFYERLKHEPEHPTTSQVPPGEMGETFDRLLDKGHDVLAILLSKKISGTYQSAILASKVVLLEDLQMIQPVVESGIEWNV